MAMVDVTIQSNEGLRTPARELETFPLAEHYLAAAGAFTDAVDQRIPDDASLMWFAVSGRKRFEITHYKEGDVAIYSVMHKPLQLGQRALKGFMQATSLKCDPDESLWGESHLYCPTNLDLALRPIPGRSHPLGIEEWQGAIRPVTRLLNTGVQLIPHSV